MASVEDDNVRFNRLDVALEKFLELIDEKAAIEKFQVAFPSLKPALLKAPGEEFVSELKVSIKLENDRLLDKYGLKEKLAELEKLTREAETRNSNGSSSKDVWRANLDLPTMLYSRSIPVQQERVSFLEQELREIEAENRELYSQLEGTIEDEDVLRREASDSLQFLHETIEGLETSEDKTRDMRKTIDKMHEQLGPRGTSFRPP